MEIIMNIGFWSCIILAILFVIIGVLFAIFKEKAAKFVSGFNSFSKEEQALYDKAQISRDIRNQCFIWAVIMLAGALFAIILLTRYQYDLIASIRLIFYGLGLINASKYIFDELHYLGIIEVALCLLSLIWLEQGLLFWTIGFAICHIIVGIVMYRKYEKK